MTRLVTTSKWVCWWAVSPHELTRHANAGTGTAPHTHPRSSCFRSALLAGGDGGEGEGTGAAGGVGGVDGRHAALHAFRSVAKGADCVVGKGGAFDVRGKRYLSARRCMRIVDTDRLEWAREQARRQQQAQTREAGGGGAGAGASEPGGELLGGYTFSVGELQPLSCSPKCSVLLVARRAPKSLVEPSAC